jgi:hypothetical protein
MKSIGISNQTNWSNRSSYHLNLVTSKTPKNHAFIPHEIQKLVEEIVEEINGVKRVIGVATSFPDIHWIDFQIGLKEDIELSDETWEQIQDMVIDCEWKLIDDSGEEWYFRPQIVDSFYFIGEKKIADSDNKHNSKIRKLKTWSIDAQFA